MNPTQVRIFGIGILFLLIFLTGVWLSHLGKPLGSVPITIHKLIALADFILLMITVYWINKSAPLQPVILTAVIIAVVFFIATIITGGLVSVLATGGFADLTPSVRTAISLSHKVLPYLTLLSTGVTLYLAIVPRAG
jgi:hypothetical protein